MNSSKQKDRPTTTRTNLTLVTTTAPPPPHSSSTLPQKRSLDGDPPPMVNKKQQFIRRSKNCTNYTQACLLLHAIEINRRQLLDPRCIAHLANYVVKAWETDPNETKVRQLYQLMQNLLSTTAIKQPTLESALITFCQNTASTPTPCPSVTLLIAIGYIERLNKKYDIVKGTVGCGSRLIIIAYLMAAKFLHDNLKLIIHVPTTSAIPSQPPKNTTSPSIESTQKQQQHHHHLQPEIIVSTTSLSSETVSSTSPSILPEPLKSTTQPILPTSPPTSPSSLDTLTTCSVMSPPRHRRHLPTTPNIPPLTPPYISRTKPAATPLSASTPIPEHGDSSSSSSTTNTALSTKESLSTSPSPSNERYLRIMRLELEFLHFLDYDLSTTDPAKLVHWAHTFDTHPIATIDDCCTSADEGDDEMDDDDDGIDTCTLD